ncbi:uncharacterized protein MONOS_11382 [Monocercomonoides exilis]|uniref:uncharacterized protein n=1 Tax=Monocercomonoides exilis TaxID=2049356 RepID=UPI0035595D7C|nr:hypothetical protein MONOS_11382 [Monocercomonoides exilis]|eukprot:MONOS_11382.1-p1 / transcript=MONOS_11382.1 / gene=MONOS_11382 / organism=Monocercomonoides_exilis_PA203 / gene_product=unspecified product / transcript_product=unspecified product / location=Mono_scaffold00568:20683-22095(-) / protein_length=429 / sequence_SO=supercontig / SO=protein_coding / is_pseudo=false
MQTTSRIKRFNELFSGLEDCNEDEQRKKIGKMNEIVDGMNKKEFESVFKTELYDKMYEMIEERKLSMESSLVLLKSVGCYKALKGILIFDFERSSLYIVLEKMIVEEDLKKKEEKNEKLLADLCECHLLLSGWFSSKFLSICVPCLLKVALNKDESKEAQKDVEMSLLALSNVEHYELGKELYLNEIKEIIKYHQEHRNLMRLAYQSAWEFLICRLYFDKSLEKVISNELHFAREATRELEEQTRNMDWKKKEEEMDKEEANEVLIIRRWIKTLEIYFSCCQLWNEEYVGLFNSIVQIYRAAKDNCRGISYQFICLLRSFATNRALKIDDLLESEAVGSVLEEVTQLHVIDEQTSNYLDFFKRLCERLNSESKMESDTAKRKELKRKVLEKMEEGGYEDFIIGFSCCKIIRQHFFYYLVPFIDDYFVY